jgi:predicted SnoaL-like aldol condensation-catalyzing enzyme
MKEKGSPMKPIVPALAACLVAWLALAAPARAETPEEQANIKTVEAFYDAAINAKDYDAAKAYLGDRYVQHNPTAQDGPTGLKAFVDFLKAKFPTQHNDVKQAFADGDYVILHVHSVRDPAQPGRAIVDIFRLDHGKVVEHWDVIQDIPATSANGNGMF